MAVQIKITFDGEVPGIGDHKLDLASFGAALTILTDGLRRTASGLVNEALEPQKRGPVAKRGDLHVFLGDIGEGSLELVMSVEPPDMPGYNFDLVEDLPARAVKHFLGAVEDESKGALRNSIARKFLRSLPSGLTWQRYEAFSGSTSLVDFKIGTVTLPDEPQDLPVVVRVMARVVGVTFDPTPEVRLETGETRISFSATTSLVNAAVHLHEEDIMAVGIVTGNKGRLLWLDRPETFPKPPTKAELSTGLLRRWEGTLERLSR
jgi:hypothetical protein